MSECLSGAMNDRKDRRDEPGVMSIAGAGFEFAAALAVFMFLGWLGDQAWGTEPWLMLAGLGVGMVGGTYKLWRFGRRFFS